MKATPGRTGKEAREALNFRVKARVRLKDGQLQWHEEGKRGIWRDRSPRALRNTEAMEEYSRAVARIENDWRLMTARCGTGFPRVREEVCAWCVELRGRGVPAHKIVSLILDRLASAGRVVPDRTTIRDWLVIAGLRPGKRAK
jgi:hypothetical protein